jgi:hypothetical protein
MKATTTSWAVAGVGAAVSAIGATMLKNKSRVGAGVLGFGLAHVALGMLDMLRPSVRD